MPMISAGTTAIFTIPAGQVATVLYGTGTAFSVFPSGSPASVSPKSSIGPFRSARIVNISATTDIEYSVALPSNGVGVNPLLAIVTKPAISTTATAGGLVSATYSIIGTPTPEISIQWVLNGVDVAGATSIPYSSPLSDAGKSLQVRVTATNISGAISSTSDAVIVSAGVPLFGGNFTQQLTINNNIIFA